MPKSNPDKESLGMVIDGKLLKRLRAIKEDREIHNNTEMVRVLIKEEYDRLAARERNLEL